MAASVGVHKNMILHFRTTKYATPVSNKEKRKKERKEEKKNRLYGKEISCDTIRMNAAVPIKTTIKYKCKFDRTHVHVGNNNLILVEGQGSPNPTQFYL